MRSLQATVIDILMSKLRKAAKDLYIKEVAVAGGVSANSGLREAFLITQNVMAGKCISRSSRSPRITPLW